MRRKIPLLFFLLSVILTSCSISSNLSLLKSPPTDFFVKVYKEMVLTRCLKILPKLKEKKKLCETKNAYTTGSGLMVRVSQKEVVVLTAGHVCKTEGLTEEDRKYR